MDSLENEFTTIKPEPIQKPEVKPFFEHHGEEILNYSEIKTHLILEEDEPVARMDRANYRSTLE